MRPLLRSAFMLAVTVLLGATAVSGAAAQTENRPTPTEAAYLSATLPFRDKLGGYLELLAAHQKAATEGKLDNITLAELGDLTRELFLARQTFNTVIPSSRLDLYDRTMKLGLDRAYEATVLLMRAQVTDSAADNAALIRAAGEQAHSSNRLLREAADELQMLLPATAL